MYEALSVKRNSVKLEAEMTGTLNLKIFSLGYWEGIVKFCGLSGKQLELFIRIPP